jgi:acyl carrier protein
MWLAHERITLAFLPTPLAEAVLAEEAPADLRLRALLTGGDVLHAPPPRPLPFAVVNHYGPTECTVVASATPVAATDPAGVPPPIGSPIRNVEAHVLDPRGRPQPIGVPGELHLAGIALARGYYDDPDATRTAFGPHAYFPDRKLYRTGDRVVRLPDGRLRFLGRLDLQLKVRGIRVEAGDVVAQLVAHPEIREAAVTLHGDVLAAYVVARGEIPPAPADLRTYLAERLAGALVPASFTVLDQLPLTQHGKVNLRALPTPAQPAGAGTTSDATSTEAAVAAIFAELFDAAQIGPEDNFFDVGGHSLLATRLVSRIRATLGVEVPVRRVFEGGSVKSIAAAVEEARVGGVVDDLPALQPAARHRYRATVDADGCLTLSDEVRAVVLDLAENGAKP